ncbi:hypothetical protein [Pseudalkalibacillus salsuginis]|uniref:hypothetical protein n=1 Tax=Pseudalkalibacillus salsuginis TaxID=2910972 RepID=UPI001F27861C|nr:hypothetical protein [Pseudalkalibacillus salsuginis]MCF6410683.1 hypothetical protein [Pseudalkalibacillus salsuginis]
MKKPGIVKFIQVIQYIHLGGIILLLAAFWFFLVFKGVPGGYFYDFRAGFLSSVEINHENYTSRDFGYLTGLFSIPLILNILVLIFLQKRKYKSLIAVFILNILIGFSNLSLFFIIDLGFLLLILLNKNAKQYLKRDSKVHDQMTPSI